MMNYDDRFDFPKFELPNVWLTFTKGGGGTFKSADGKMKLPPGHSLASKFPEKVATKEEMAEREAKLKAKEEPGKLAKVEVVEDDEPAKVVKAEVVLDDQGMMNLSESLDYTGKKLKELKDRMEKTDRNLVRAVGEYVGATNSVIDNLTDIATDGKMRFNPEVEIPIPKGSGKRAKTLEEEVGGMNLQESLQYSQRKLDELQQRRQSSDRKTFRAIGEYVDATNQTITNIAKEAGVSTGLGGSTAKSRKGMGGSKKPKQLKGS
jgi:ElaB/YqjD/DUF883 family membrane-anchored ribosome-binding protein